MQQPTQTELKAVTLTELRSTISVADYEQFRRMVIMRCMITNATWSNWTTGKFVPEKKYQPLIDRVAARFGLTIFLTTQEEGGQE